jgi:hypothetical protein
VFCFKEKADADKFTQAFDGEPFDPRDKGGDSAHRARVSGQQWNLYGAHPVRQ